jgi:hypothetical protein
MAQRDRIKANGKRCAFIAVFPYILYEVFGFQISGYYLNEAKNAKKTFIAFFASVDYRCFCYAGITTFPRLPSKTASWRRISPKNLKPET